MMLDDREFADSIKQWQGKFQALGRNLQPLGQTMTAVGASLTAPFILGTRQLLTYTRQLDFTAARLGVAADNFGRFANLAQLTNVSLEALEIGMKTIGERIIQLKAGSGETAMAFQELGIAADDFINASGNMERLLMLADAFSKVEDAGMQSGLALRALGESGNRMLPLLRLGREGIQDLQKSLEVISVDSGAIAASRELGLAWEQMKIAVATLTAEIAETLVPVMVRFLTVSTDVLSLLIQWVRRNPALVAAIGIVGQALTVTGAALLAIGVTSKVVATQVTLVRDGFNLLATTLTTRVIPALIQTEMHISGIGVSLTALGSGLLKFTGVLAAFFVPLTAVSGTGPLSAVQTFMNTMNATIWEMIAGLSILPDKWREFAQTMAALERAEIADREGLTDFARPVEKTKATGSTPGRTPLITSAIGARFANQQTMGFAMGQVDYQAQIAASSQAQVDILQNLLDETKANSRMSR